MIKQNDEDKEYQDRPVKRKRSKTGPASTRKRIDYIYHPFIPAAWKTAIIKNEIILKGRLISYLE